MAKSRKLFLQKHFTKDVSQGSKYTFVSPEAYLEPNRTDFSHQQFLRESCIVDIRLGSKYASGVYIIIVVNKTVMQNYILK